MSWAVQLTQVQAFTQRVTTPPPSKNGTTISNYQRPIQTRIIFQPPSWAHNFPSTIMFMVGTLIKCACGGAKNLAIATTCLSQFVVCRLWLLLLSLKGLWKLIRERLEYLEESWGVPRDGVSFYSFVYLFACVLDASIRFNLRLQAHGRILSNS